MNRPGQRAIEIEQRRELILDQGVVVRVGPEAVLPVRIEALPALLTCSERGRDLLVLPGLVYDFRKRHGVAP
jgi:hypothetical protein